MAMMSIFDISGSGMSAQSVRLNTVASNLANAETTSSSVEDTYRARHPVFRPRASFAETLDQRLQLFENEGAAEPGRGVEVMGVVESEAPLDARYEPDHPMANEEGYVYYPNVNVVEEMTDMMSASRSFQSNVEVMNTAKSMMQRLLTLGQ